MKTDSQRVQAIREKVLSLQIAAAAERQRVISIELGHTVQPAKDGRWSCLEVASLAGVHVRSVRRRAREWGVGMFRVVGSHAPRNYRWNAAELKRLKRWQKAGGR